MVNTRRIKLFISLLLIVVFCATMCLSACDGLFPDVNNGNTNHNPDDGDEVTKYTLSYVPGASDATGEIPEAQSYEEGEEIVVKPATTFSRQGYTFTAWSDGTLTYKAGATFMMPAHDLTLMPQWKPNEQQPTPPPVGDTSTTVTATEVKFDNGNLVFKGTVGGGVKTLVAYLYDTDEGVESYKATAIISNSAFTVSIGLSQLTAKDGNWYYLMVSVNGGAKTKVAYTDYGKDETYDYEGRRYKWEYYEGIAVNYAKLSYNIDIDGVSVRGGQDGHVYLSVSGTSSGYSAKDFAMDLQLQSGAYTRYSNPVTVTFSAGRFIAKMDISNVPSNTNDQYYTIHLFVDGVSNDVASSKDPWIVETSATDDNKIFKLKSDKAWWGDYVMKVTIETKTSQFSQQDYLKVNGADVRKNYGQGDVVMLRGTNAGGYFVSEEWMTAVDYKDYKTASKILSNRFSDEIMLDLWGYYRSYLWSDTDFKNCADMGITAIRLPFTYMNVDYFGDHVYDFSALDDFIRGAAKYGIYTILDLHGAYGSQNGQDHSGEVIDNASQVDFYKNAEKKANTVALWKALAEHYKGNPAVAAFDLLNEPGIKGGTTTKTQWDFYDEMYKAIRQVDGDRIIIFESCWTGSNLPNPSQYGWQNCMYSFHHYVGETDGNGNKYSLNQLKDKMLERIADLNTKNFGIPLYMGEFTCYSNEDFWVYTLNLFAEYGWHWTSWTYKTSWNMGGWSVYYNWANKPDLEKDSIATIKDKWRGISTTYAEQTKFDSGKTLKDVFKQALKG